MLGRRARRTMPCVRLPERVDFRVAVMAYRVLHGLDPPYFSQLARVADLPSRHRLRFSSSHQLHVPPFRLSTVGGRSFPVAAAILWNTLSVDVQSSLSLPVFRQRLKTFLFHKLFLDVVWQTVDSVMAYCYFSHVTNFLIDWLNLPSHKLCSELHVIQTITVCVWSWYPVVCNYYTYTCVGIYRRPIYSLQELSSLRTRKHAGK